LNELERVMEVYLRTIRTYTFAIGAHRWAFTEFRTS
jgi:hypothetical protein